MRKHFLLLFLMALLPLAGFALPAAEALSDKVVQISLTNTDNKLEYTGNRTTPAINEIKIFANATDAEAGEPVENSYTGTTWSEKFVWKFYAATPAATPGTYEVGDELDYIRNAGHYYVSIAAKTGNEDYEGTALTRVLVEIQKADLHITLSDATITYGQADPTQLTMAISDGSALKGNTDDINNIGLTFVPNPLPRTNPAKKGFGDYPYTFTLVDGNNEPVVSQEIIAQNYNIYIDNNPTLHIERAPLTAYYDVADETAPVSAEIVREFNNRNQTVEVTAAQATAKLFFTGWQWNDATLYEEGAFTTLGDLTFTVTNAKEANAPYNYGDELIVPFAEGYECEMSLSGVDATTGVWGNYVVTYSNPKMYIKQKQITADGFTGGVFVATQTTPNFTYDGTKQIPSNITVKYFDLSGDEPEELETLVHGATENNDIVISYQWEKIGGDTYVADENGNKYAGAYKAYITAVANGNYYTAADPIEATALAYNIKQRDLTVYAGDKTETYSAVAADITKVELGWSGLTTADEAAVTDDNKTVATYFENKFVKIVGNTVTVIGAPTKAGVYNVKPQAKDAFAYPATSLANNYKAAFSAGLYTIEKKAMTITAAPQRITFGEELAINTTIDPKDGDNDAEYTVILDGVIDNNTVSEKEAVVTKIKLALDLEKVTNAVDTYDDAIVVDSIAGTVANVLDNYQVTFNYGAFTIDPTTFTVFAKANTKVYGTDYTLDAAGGFAYGTVNFSGTWPEGATVSYKLRETEDGPDLTERPKNFGTYYIVPVVENWPTTGTDYAQPAIQTGLFKITKKEVYVKPDALSLNNGSTVAALQSMGSVKYFESDAADAQPIVLPNKDNNLEYTLAFYENGDDAEAVTLTEDKLDCTVGETYEHGITVNLVAEADVNKNYDIHVLYGAITVLSANTLTISNTDVNLYNKIQLAAQDCAQHETTTYNVTFATTRTLKGKQWESFVLPFEVSVGQLSAAMKATAGDGDYGYAIFNVYNESTSDDTHVRFSLNMNTIPANTPFLIKTEKDVALGNQVTINGVRITDPGSANPTKVVEGKVTMTGCYAATPITNKDWFFFQGTWMCGAESTTNPTILPATMAYWTPAGVNARVFVEDLNEDGTTAIKEINAQNMREIAAEGWYTLNGVKLQSMPTEKGVYINNGKKVVIK